MYAEHSGQLRLTFAAASFSWRGCADAVSRRFIISDTDVSRLAVIDEFRTILATLASGRPPFPTVTALAIDRARGSCRQRGRVSGEMFLAAQIAVDPGRVLQKFLSETDPPGRS
jgi:hypothetical protein